MSDAWIRALVALPFGLALGSFMTVVVSRVPAGESVVRPRSRCPRCGAEIANRDNIPVVSWVLLRGRCRSCGERHPRALSAARALDRGPGRRRGRGLRASLGGGDDGRVPVADAGDRLDRHRPSHHPEPHHLSGVHRLRRVYVVVAWAFDGGTDPVRALIGALLYAGVLFVVAIVSRGMGMGDVKLALVIGVVLGALGLRFVGGRGRRGRAVRGAGRHRGAGDRARPQGGDPVRARTWPPVPWSPRSGASASPTGTCSSFTGLLSRLRRTRTYVQSAWSTGV